MSCLALSAGRAGGGWPTNPAVLSYDGGSNLIQVGSPARLTYTYDGNERIVQEARADGTSNRYSLYGRSGRRYFEEDTVNFELTQYVYLGQDLVLSRSSCTATTDTDGLCTSRRVAKQVRG